MIEQSKSPLDLRNIDQLEFGALAESHRRELRAHCYRMLGCIQEAEEMVQETLWRAWNRRETYEGRSTFRAWLYKIATNQCLDVLKRRPRRSLSIAREESSPLERPIPASITEPIWLDPYPDDLPTLEDASPEAHYSTSESIRLAFLTVLHLLPPRQRAVLILRDVLDWQADEVADGQPGYGLYKLNEATGDYEGYGIQVVTFDGNQIIDITTFRNPALMAFFGLPSTLTA